MITTIICVLTYPMVLISIGFGCCFFGGIYAFRILTSEPREINKTEERLRANKLAAIEAEKKLGGLKK